MILFSALGNRRTEIVPVAVVRVMMMLTECVIERSFPGDRLRVAVVEQSLRVHVHVTMRAIVVSTKFDGRQTVRGSGIPFA
jgi:hypothetical protein